MTISELVKAAHANAVDKGFWPRCPQPINIPKKLALIHSEVSEALEAIRMDPGLASSTYFFNEKPEGFAIELADILIRVAGLAGGLNLDLEKAIETKMAFNRTRPLRHGKAF